MSKRMPHGVRRKKSPKMKRPSSVQKSDDNALSKEADQILKAVQPLPQPQRETVERAVNTLSMRITHQRTEFSGPIPSPELYREYENILPGAADRILKMAEIQQSHRHELEKSVIVSDIVQARIGLIFGFIYVMTAILGGIHLLNTGRDITGLSVLVGALVTLAGVFIFRQRKIVRELQERSNEVKKK